MAAPADFEDLGLSILGVASEYPPHSLPPSALEELSKRFYPESSAMQKVLSINRYTGIDQRSSIGTPDHPIVNQPNPPSITELHEAFMSYGVPLAVTASRKALAEAHVDAGEVTHMVSTTCTNSANPGYDHFVAKELGLSQTTEKVLLHGVGCSGGLAALRTAANLCLGHSMRRKPARILVVALEISTTLVRSELESINALQETRIGVALFSDCAGALLLSNDIPSPNSPPPPPPLYTLLGWHHHTVPSTEADLGFDVDPLGWKVILSPRVPSLTQSVLAPSFNSLLSTLPPLPPTYHSPADFDWAMHPGGATILSGAERALALSPEHMRASYDTYINHGNSSSATILSVLDRLRAKDMDALAPAGHGGPREYVVGCAFGPGIAVEMCMLKRNLSHGGERLASRPGMETPPETESEGGGASEDGDEEVGSERGEQVIDEENAGGKVPLEGRGSETAQEAFISEALEGVELD